MNTFATPLALLMFETVGSLSLYVFTFCPPLRLFSYLCTVKRLIWIFSLLTAGLFFCLGSGSGSPATTKPTVFQVSDCVVKQGGTLVSAPLLQRTAKAESASSVSGNAYRLTQKIHFCNVTSQRKIAERLLVSFIHQYRFYAKKLLFRLQIADLIFPFHYFW